MIGKMSEFKKSREKELSLCHKLKYFNIANLRLFDPTKIIFETSMVYDIGFKKYRDKKTRYFSNSSIPFIWVIDKKKN